MDHPLLQIAYLVSAILFIFSLYWMNDPKTARRGVFAGAGAMGLAIAATWFFLEPDKSGVVHHVAFASFGFDGMKQRLEAKGMAYESRQVPGGDLWQIFVDDPNGVMIELNYEAAKEQGESAPAERMDDIGAR